ncbi:hypothetical protein DSO57_1034992, partial [Entomophthora muscae]
MNARVCSVASFPPLTYPEIVDNNLLVVSENTIFIVVESLVLFSLKLLPNSHTPSLEKVFALVRKLGAKPSYLLKQGVLATLPVAKTAPPA